MKTRTIPLLVLPLFLACILARPAPAGEEERTIPLFSDRKGDAGWIEMDRTEGRTRATPYLRVSGETVRRAAETSGRAREVPGTAAAEIRKPDPAATTDRKGQGLETLAPVRAGPEGGVSLEGVLDLAREVSESAKDAFRKVRAGNTSPPRRAGTR